MERDPLLPAHNRTPAEAPRPQTEQERGGFFEKLRKKTKRSPETAPSKKQVAPEAEQAPEVPRPERRAFGKEILGIIFGTKAESPEPIPQAEASESQPPLTDPEQTPQFERATRMRRFARVIIARVMGEAAGEPARAHQHGEAEPLDMHNLVEAAHDLRDAADDLNETAGEAREVSREQLGDAASAESYSGGGDYDAFVAPERIERLALSAKNSAAERLDERLRQLEISAEDSRRASIAAVGLGVIAVIVTGTEYFSRKHNEREIRHDLKEVKREFKKQERAMEQQRVVFDRLRDTQTKEMDRNQRQDYYERLSTFTHRQADRTREANRELQLVVQEARPAEMPVRTHERRREEQPAERREWRSRQPEVVAANEQPEIAPLVRVETADTIERAPGQQTGSAGTGFFGGGGGGIAEGTGPSDLERPRVPIDPNSPEARRLEELRRIEQVRLQQNAWFYGAALIVTMVGAVVAAIYLG